MFWSLAFVDVFYSLALEDGIIALTMYYDDDEESRSPSNDVSNFKIKAPRLKHINTGLYRDPPIVLLTRETTI